ncbi:MAG TPA: LamG domain-containing protein [Kofleriaceae bacterium]|nr:LamG domain-containing protein [Kofleriaceae bacterium]
MTDSRFFAAAGVTFVASCLSTPPASDVDAAPTTCVRDLEGGTFDRTRPLTTDFIALATGETMGYFTTRVFAAPPSGRFGTLRWETVRPSLKALPDNRGRETAYLQGSADLASNQLLFHFDDPPAWDDTSGNDLSATCMSSPANQCPTVTPGLFRDALELDVDEDAGSDTDNDRLRIANNAALETPQVTLEVWVRPNRAPAVGSRMMVVHKGTASPAQPPFASYSIEYSNNMTFRCYANVGAVAGEELIDGTRVSAPMQWHHVACTYDGSRLRMFVDGFADGELPAAGTLTYGLSDNDLILGDYSGSQFLDGAVDELAVHSAVLSPAVLQERARRGALRLAWQVRACDDAACDGEGDAAWRGPNGTPATMFTEACSTDPDHPTLALFDLDCDGDGNPDDGADEAIPPAPFYQARALFDTHRSPDTPELVEFELCQ